MYDGLDLIADLNESDSLVASYTHGPGIDDPLIVRKSGNDYFYYKNHQGSVTELRDSSGAGYKTYVYDAFGNMEETGPTFNRGFTYTGRELHNRSGLYYYRARFYNPKLGRFITQDPIGYLGGINLYAYVRNDPANWVDPLGLQDMYPYYALPPEVQRDYAAAYGRMADFAIDSAGAVYDFYEGWHDVRAANTINADKYFHCRANYEAASRGPGGIATAEILSEIREVTDEILKGDAKSDCDIDRRANRIGREGAINGQELCDVCGPLRPPYLDEKWR